MTYRLRTFQGALLALCAGSALFACAPTVKVEAPDEPITINLNVNISHEVRVKIDRDLESAIDNKSGIF